MTIIDDEKSLSIGLPTFLERGKLLEGMLFNRVWDRHKKLIFIIFLFILPVLPLALSNVRMPRFHFYDYFSALIVHPTAAAFNNAVSGIEIVWQRYFNLVNVQIENENLKKANQELQAEINSLSEVKLENDRLRAITGIPEFEKYKGVAARIIGQNASSEGIAFYINLGERDNITPRLPVVSVNGIVGTITKVFHSSSVFTSILDPAHDVDGVVIRSRAGMIVEGKGRPLLARLKYLDRSEDLRVGDEVITSGLDGVFPKGLLIGHIVRVSRPQVGVIQEADLRAAVDMGKLEEVVVLRSLNENSTQEAAQTQAKGLVGPPPPPSARAR